MRCSALSAQRRDVSARKAAICPPIFAARRVRGSAKRPPAHIRKKSDKGGHIALCLAFVRSLATLCVAFKLIKQYCAACGLTLPTRALPVPVLACLPVFLAVFGSLVKGAGVEPAFLCSAVVPPLVGACGLSRPLACLCLYRFSALSPLSVVFSELLTVCRTVLPLTFVIGFSVAFPLALFCKPVPFPFGFPLFRR